MNRTWKLRYSLVLKGKVIARKSMTFRAPSYDAALKIGAGRLVRDGFGLLARITSLKGVGNE